MKKALLGISCGIAIIMTINVTNATGGAYPVIKAGQGNFVQDTIPMRKKDSGWNKKKYPDTTSTPKRDTVHHLK